MEKHFHEPPDDWSVGVTDIVDSTEAIEEGRFRDVNTIGAATISTAQNVLGTLEFPFAFGGDGATLLIPPDFSEQVFDELAGLKTLATRNFGLNLRVGSVSIRDLRGEGDQIQVARYQITPGKTVGIFRGGGATRAEEMIRNNPDRYAIKPADQPIEDLEGLSCRWKPIPSNNGVVLSLLVKARGDDTEPVYRDVLDYLNQTFNGNLDSANPVNLPEMAYQSVLDSYRREKEFARTVFSLSFLKRFLEIVLAVAIFKWNINPLFFDPDHYKEALAAHSDFRKFDDLLQMTIDCTPQQADQIEDYLQERLESGDIFYGTHRADSALMTCYVQNLDDGDHIHFIDGGGGGYTRASIPLKKQINETTKS